ncbi:FMN-dependent NADH-azoreductase 1 [Paenibacillus baekrokdamisoli]|uniref:FMN dependent NADH:quinone oxidoreductase n=1 Tax=Paenibacillus baekrokdamisoli TaxID=1712516 RepID=A0A3G9J9I2_9BACL|nr:FMN-dependent NADH-azoreductase [Paenibacillus baekrokdamisoli]MBB3072471.1 FMN-dependent NADH-azoreductase [Paenibacillus baekrokdamisoli]BBH20528.1 FMN-dependent NADH-azoreductase 1 [Paenibacillus baekrokdamisoli]
MAKVLFIKANDRPADQATSVKLYDAFIKAYTSSNPTDEITELDLFNVELPYYDNSFITALYKQGQGLELTEEETAKAKLVNSYLDQFLAADKIVFAFPLWNFTTPAQLVTYISYLSQAGKTFKYTAAGPVGLVTDKKVVLLHARGSVYSEGPMSNIEAALRFVKGTIGLWGLKAEEVIIEGHNQFPDRAQDILNTGLEEAKQLAATF